MVLCDICACIPWERSSSVSSSWFSLVRVVESLVSGCNHKLESSFIFLWIEEVMFSSCRYCGKEEKGEREGEDEDRKGKEKKSIERNVKLEEEGMKEERGRDR